MCVVFSGFTSLFNGLVVFTILGFMAHDTGTSVEELSRQSGKISLFLMQKFPCFLKPSEDVENIVGNWENDSNQYP